MTRQEQRTGLLEDLYGYFQIKEVFTSQEFKTKLDFNSYPNAMHVLKKLTIIGLVEATGNNRTKKYRLLERTQPISYYLAKWDNDIKQKDCINERNPTHLVEIISPKVRNCEKEIKKITKQLAVEKAKNETNTKKITELKAQNEALNKRLQLIEKPFAAIKEAIKLITC